MFVHGSVYFVCFSKTESKATTETCRFWRTFLFNHKQILTKQMVVSFLEKSVGFREAEKKKKMFGEALGSKKFIGDKEEIMKNIRNPLKKG